jgi:UDP-N-acetylenolpyruvoylglucosamine reductase
MTPEEGSTAFDNFRFDMPDAMVEKRRAAQRFAEIEAIALAHEASCRSWEWLRKNTLLTTGTPVAAMIYPSTAAGAAQIAHQLHEAGIEWRVLGSEASVLTTESESDFVVISLRLLNEPLCFADDCVTACAGHNIVALLKEAAHRGLSGLERLGGLTGTLGSVLQMNAGIEGRTLWSRVETVTLAHAGEIREFPVSSIVIGDGLVCVKKTDLILSVTLRLTSALPVEVRAETERWEDVRLTNLRLEHQEKEARQYSPAVVGAWMMDQVSERRLKLEQQNPAPEDEVSAGMLTELNDLFREEAEKMRLLNAEGDFNLWGDESSERDSE